LVARFDVQPSVLHDVQSLLTQKLDPPFWKEGRGGGKEAQQPVGALAAGPGRGGRRRCALQRRGRPGAERRGRSNCYLSVFQQCSPTQAERAIYIIPPCHVFILLPLPMLFLGCSSYSSSYRPALAGGRPN